MNYGSEVLTKLANIDSIENIADNATGEMGTAIYTSVGSDANTLPELVLYTPIRAFYFMYSPVPWDWRSVKQVTAFFTSGFMWCMLSYETAKYFKRKIIFDRKRNFFICLFILCVLFIGVFAWGTRGANAAIRHREKILTLVGMMYAIAKSENKIILLKKYGKYYLQKGNR